MVDLFKKENLFKWSLVLSIYCQIYSPAYALPSNRLISATHHISNNIETIQIKTFGNPNLHIFQLSSPQRIVCTLSNTFFSKVHQNQTVDGRNILKVRISQNTKNSTRLVLDVLKDKSYLTHKTKLSKNIYLTTISFPNAKKTAAIKKNALLQPVLLAQIGSNIPHEPASSILKAKTQVLNTSPSNKIAPPAKQEPSLQIVSSENQTLTAFNQSSFDEAIFDQTDLSYSQKNTPKDMRVSASIQTRISIDTDHDNTNENKFSFKNRSILKIKYKNDLVLSVLSDYLYFGSKNETDSYDIDLFETYLRHSRGYFTVTLGKQIKRWGKTDQISLIDTLNPVNNTEFIIPSYEEKKIPVWMADFIYRRNSFFIEGVFIPFFESDKFDYFGTDWATFTHLKDDIEDSPLSPTQKAYFASIGVQEIKPKDEDSFEYALRIGGSIEQFDFGFTYHYATEDQPTFESFPVKNLSLRNSGSIQDILSNLGSLTLTNESIRAKYLRTHIFGLEFETILSSMGIRGEAAFKENVSLLTSSLTSVRKPTLSWIVGIDYTSENNWYFNLQFAHQYIKNFESDILFYDQDNYSLIGEINKNLIADWLNVSIQGTTMINDGSYYLSPRLLYTYIKNFEAIFGVHLFEGSDDSIFGQYTRNDQIFIDLKYYF
ncbi:MAG: AMIN domain-containing protein [Desulfobacula sp.]|nr:AMIN domain-containing protein [Desulfobacula sp.]